MLFAEKYIVFNAWLGFEKNSSYVRMSSVCYVSLLTFI